MGPPHKTAQHLTGKSGGGGPTCRGRESRLISKGGTLEQKPRENILLGFDTTHGQEAGGRGQGAELRQFGKDEEHREALKTQSRAALSGKAPQSRVGTGQTHLGASKSVSVGELAETTS